MTPCAARGRSFVRLAAAPVVFALAAFFVPCASAQTDDPSTVAARVHAEGGYPEDITVIDDETDDTTLDGDDPNGGAGRGPHGSIHPRGDRDGGDASRGLDIPLPQFVRDLLHALAEMIGAAAGTLTYVLFAVGIALILVFVVYLVTLFRFPKRDLATVRRDRRYDAGQAALDPLLEEALQSPEEYARQGRFREAIHAVFVRSLSETARAGDVDRRGRTAREVVTAIAKIQSTPPELADLLALAELVWFGGRPATETQYVHAVDLAARIRVGGPRGAALDGGSASAPSEAP
jgi:hypothetical protein